MAAKAERLRIGIGTEKGVHIGPLHSERQREILEDQLARTLDAGGEGLAGGGGPRRRGGGPRRSGPWDGRVPRADGGPRAAARLADGDGGDLRPGAADLARPRP